jgi:hypothetical protein
MVFGALTILSSIWLIQTLYSNLFLHVEGVDEIIERFKNLPPPAPKLYLWQRAKAYFSRRSED